MTYTQAITPNPNIACRPGWCLEYVNNAFGVAERFYTAFGAWAGSETQHADYDFPADLWVPLWFSLENEPAGHVALRAPDGSVYSTTHPYSTVPTRHPSLADLIYTYSFHNPLTYLGWTEDVEGTPVITLEVEDMLIDPVQAESIAARAAELVIAALNGKMLINRGQADDIALRAASVTLEHMPDVSADVVKEIKDKISGLSFEVVAK